MGLRPTFSNPRSRPKPVNFMVKTRPVAFEAKENLKKCCIITYPHQIKTAECQFKYLIANSMNSLHRAL